MLETRSVGAALLKGIEADPTPSWRAKIVEFACCEHVSV
jgi:hypothetical protein